MSGIQAAKTGTTLVAGRGGIPQGATACPECVIGEVILNGK
ncbi:MAG: hypothetical protein OXD49_08890 [Candidatus Poribacteria bacterium]|nr:hypothetical protein [Candidatus Poribacteria bacterium]